MVYLTIKKRLKYLVVGPGARKTFQLSGRTLRIYCPGQQCKIEVLKINKKLVKAIH